MPVKDSKRAANDKWDKENMAYQSIKVRKELLDEFKAKAAERGDKVNTLFREFMEQYIKSGGQ